MQNATNIALISGILFFSISTSSLADETARVGEMTITGGVGGVTLFMPDATSMLTRTTNSAPFTIFETYDFSDDFGSAFGWNVNGSISAPLPSSLGGFEEVSLSGFWARVDDKSGFTCTGDMGPQLNCLIAPLVDDPTTQQIGGTLGAQSITATNSRRVDYWGASLEGKRPLGNSFFDYLSVGLDVRGLDQDISSRMAGTSGTLITYDESLDTTYVGAFAAVGTKFVPLGGIGERLGIETSVRFQGGLYWKRTDFDGILSETAPFPGGGGDPSGALSLSDSGAAFIGGLNFETRKKISNRVALSWTSNLEFNSSVPKMHYNQIDLGPVDITDPGRNAGTRIGSAGMFSMRSGIRLTIGLGPDSLYE